MNRNQVKGTAKKIAGKVQQKVGEATGRPEHEIKGGVKQVEGTIQKGVGDVEEELKRARDDARRESEHRHR